VHAIEEQDIVYLREIFRRTKNLAHRARSTVSEGACGVGCCAMFGNWTNVKLAMKTTTGRICGGKYIAWK